MGRLALLLPKPPSRVSRSFGVRSICQRRLISRTVRSRQTVRVTRPSIIILLRLWRSTGFRRPTGTATFMGGKGRERFAGTKKIPKDGPAEEKRKTTHSF